MKILPLALTFLVLLESLVSTAPTFGDSPAVAKSDHLPTTLHGFNIESDIVFDSSVYPVTLRNSTNLAIYVAKASFVESHVKRDANPEAAPWNWYYPIPMDPFIQKIRREFLQAIASLYFNSKYDLFKLL